MEPSKKHTLLRYLAYARPYPWRIVMIIITGVGVFSLPMVAAWLVKVVADDVIPNGDYTLLWWVTGGFLGVELMRSVAIYLRGINRVKLNNGIVFDLRQDLWKHLQRLSLGFHQSRPTGSLLSRLMGDVNVAQQLVSNGMINVFIDGGCAVVAATVLFLINWEMALLVLGILPIYGYVYHKVNPQLRRASHAVQEQMSVMSGSAVERLNGIAVVQSFAQEKAEAHSFAEQADDLRDFSIQRGRLNTTLKSFSQFLTQIGTHSLWIVGALLAMNTSVPPGQRMTIGEIILFTGVATHLYGPIRRLSDINIVYQNSMAAIERVFAIFDTTPTITSRPGAVTEPPASGLIEFDNVTFRYEQQGPDVLKELSFRAEAGRKTAIVGESGAGKSTLVTLIPRLYDVTAGAIRIDGVDLRDYRLKTLRRSIGIVLQDTILFSGTVRENLRYGRKEATEEELIDAAKAANAHQFIIDLPDGYDTMIGERGLTLSGGQRQRICIARTILQNPRILILDEATSALDSESENYIAEALENVMCGRTSLIIAHRLSTVINADHTLVLRDGRLVEEGTHQELLLAGGHYRHLFEEQFARVGTVFSESTV